MTSVASSSPIARDLNDIIRESGNFEPYFLHSCVLHTEKKDLTENEGVIVGPIRIERDYINDGSDYIELTLLVRPGTFIYDIFPFANDLELTLRRVKPRRGRGNRAIQFKERYKAFYLADKNASLPTKVDADREALDKGGLVPVVFQLIDLSVIAMRNSTVQGSYSSLISDNYNMSYDGLIKSLLSEAAKSYNIDTSRAIDRIYVEPAENREPLSEVVIPTGTPAMKLPEYVQNNLGGIYTGGAASYIQYYSPYESGNVEKVLFVYSLYTSDKWNFAETLVQFYVPPNRTWSYANRTFKLSSRILKVLTLPLESPSIDTKGTVLRDKGEGFRTGDENSAMDSPVTYTDDGPIFKKSTWLTEIADNEPTDGLVNAPYKGIESNHFKNAQDILSRKGEYMVLVADNIDPDLYYPGAPCSITIDVGTRLVKKVHGIIHKVVCQFSHLEFDASVEFKKKLHPLINRTYFTIYVTES